VSTEIVQALVARPRSRPLHASSSHGEVVTAPHQTGRRRYPRAAGHRGLRGARAPSGLRRPATSATRTAFEALTPLPGLDCHWPDGGRLTSWVRP
jgi:hypothetical protein